MRFTCEKCGRAYAADDRLRGRGFRMKCKQCGHLIVVPPSRRTPAPGAPAPGELAPADPAPPPEAAGPGAQLSAGGPAPEEVDPFASLAEELAQVPEGPPILPPSAEPPPPPPPAPAPVPTPPDPFLVARASTTPRPVPTPRPSLTPRPTPAPRPTEAARGPSESEEVFAELARQMDTVTGAQPLDTQGQALARRATGTPTPSPARAAPAPAPPARKSRKWIAAAAGLGFGVVGAIVAAAVFGGRSGGPAAPQAAGAAPAPSALAPAPARPPEPPPVAAPAPAPEPPAATAQPAPAAAAPQARAAPARAAPPKAKPAPRPATTPAKRAEPPRQVAAAKPASQQAPPAAPAARPASPGGTAGPAAQQRTVDRPLEEEAIQMTIARHAAAFEACSAQARREEPQLVSEPRRVTVTMTVNPNGQVQYPTLDDQELSGTALGTCLKKEAARMTFPESGGDPVRIRMPLVLK